MQPVVFSAEWFAQHQRTLLWLLRAPLLGRWFRWVLCIRRYDVGYHGRIVQLLPHAYIVANADGSRTLDARTHAKYAKRLYYAFRPLWWALHAWDQVIANPFVPALNAGFDTLTVYPEPYAGATTATAWAIRRLSASESWATIIAGAGNHVSAGNVVDHLMFMNTTGTTNVWQHMGRAVFTFDTSALTGATITSADASLAGPGGTGKSDPLSISPNVAIYAASPTSNTAGNTSDFEGISATAWSAAISYASWLVGDVYNAFGLNATGLAGINKTGVTRLGTRNANYDAAAVAPSPGSWVLGVESYIDAIFPDQTGTATDPKLVVTYSIPACLVTLLGTASV